MNSSIPSSLGMNDAIPSMQKKLQSPSVLICEEARSGLTIGLS
jgi:hypothetical protein